MSAIRKVEISQHQIEAAEPFQLLHRLPSGFGRHHEKARVRERDLEDFPDIRVVLNNKNGIGHGRFATQNVTSRRIDAQKNALVTNCVQKLELGKSLSF